MTCQLWVKGLAENGGPLYVDVVVFANWSANSPFPVLTEIGNTGTWRFFSSNPPWPYNGAGWREYPTFYRKGCSIDPDTPCDCVNGGCVPKTIYNTPGVFPSLSACESGCAKNSNCTGECVDPAEIAALGQSLNTLQSKFCR